MEPKDAVWLKFSSATKEETDLSALANSAPEMEGMALFKSDGRTLHLLLDRYPQA